ncbi:MAG TPA: BON domain-containing protein [Steroidobacteraceae bacterium]|jgi:osmotically-inducible protein OsmY|nr:BON domain-containing protein [Steroidobacteraceae bacterium]
MTRNQLLSVVTGTFLMTFVAVAHAANSVNSTDTQITDRVRSELSQKDPDIAPRVRIVTQDGVVTLSGNALSPGYVVNLLRDARKVDGVVKVENHLTVD